MAVINGSIGASKVKLISITGDPTVAPGVGGPQGSLAVDENGDIWKKNSASDTDWSDTSLSGANVTLSNLTAPTAINEDLIFDKTNPVLQSQDAPASTTEGLAIKTGLSGADNPSGPVTINSGVTDSGGPSIAPSGDVGIFTGAMTDAGSSATSGILSLGTGNNAGSGFSGIANFSTGNAAGSDSGDMNLTTGNSTPGVSGNINLITGTAGGMNRGRVFLNAGAVTIVADTVVGLVGTAVEIPSLAVAQTLKFFENDNNNFVGLKAAATIAADLTFTLPNVDGTAGQFLSTNASGILSFATAANGTLSNLTSPTAVNQDLIFNTATTTASVQTENVTTTTSDSLIVTSGTATTGTSGDTSVRTGAASAGFSGVLNLTTGAVATHNSGALNMLTGDSTTGSTGNMTITSGNLTAAGATGQTGFVSITSGNNAGTTAVNSGIVFISSGNTANGTSGAAQIFTGASSAAASGAVTIQSGNASTTSGSINITSGTGTTRGDLIIDTRKLTVPATNTAAGTTGNQTINKMSGTVNFAAAASTLTVTNDRVTTSSIVFAVVRTNDATAEILNVVPAAGSFTINLVGIASLETSVGFWVIN